MSDATNRVPDVDASADDLDLLDALLAEQGIDVAPSATAIRPGPRPARIPLSFSQELLWMLDRASPGMTAYKLPIVRRLIGPLDPVALERSITAIVNRHESLRTRFVAMDGEPAQVVDPPAPVTIAAIDVSADVDPEREAGRVLRDLAGRPFDFAGEHAFRPVLLRLGDGDHVLLFDTHHIVFDGWSRDILFRELAAGYAAFRRGGEPALPALPIQCADFALWQRDHLSGERLARLLAFWRAQLGDVTDLTDLPTDHPRARAPGFAGARATLVLPASLLAQAKELGRRHDATLYMVLLAAYMTVLHRYSGGATILVGSGSAGRTQAEIEGLIGYFNNTLVQRGDFSGDPSFGALLRQVRASALGAYDHQDVPLEKLVMELRQGREDTSDAPLFQAVLTMQDTLEQRVALDDIELRPFGIDFAATKFDLTLFPAERPDGLSLTLQYRSDLYLPETASRFLGHLGEVLVAAVADAATPVSRLRLLTAGEGEALVRWNATESPIDTLPFHEQVAARAAAFPAAVAVACDTTRLSYGDLERRANQIAHRLRALGVDRGATVGLLLDRSADAIVALLGILKAGAAYLPLATDVPAPRIAQQLAASTTRLVVTRREFAGLAAAGTERLELDTDAAAIGAERDVAPDVTVTSDDVAYVLFTSGSTGTPKGVAVTHGNVANYTAAIGRRLGLDGALPLHFATVSTLAADLGNTAIFPALAGGGTLHVIPADIALDGPRFASYAGAHAIDVLKITPSHLRALMVAAGRDGAAELLPRCWLVLGGEASTWDLVDEVRRAGSCRVLNHYGPTETTVGCATFEVTAASESAARAAGAQTVPIGAALANVQLHVLDANRLRMPVGVPGELYVAGAGVAAGYIGQPERTAERFVDLEGVGRAYRTGDRVRRLIDGNLEFLGRVDDQVKVRGFRVELGEVEHAVAAIPGVAACAVVLRDGSAAEPVIAAFVVARTAGYAVAHADRPTPERIRERLAASLPEYMVPSVVIMLDQLPLTPNGKIDKRALPAVDAAPAATATEPRTPTEAALVQIWAESLKRDAVGVHDNFFEVGGHSLIAIRILGKLTRTFGVRLPLRTLFDAPTVAQLARLVEDAGATAPVPGATTIKPVSRGEAR